MVNEFLAQQFLASTGDCFRTEEMPHILAGLPSAEPYRQTFLSHGLSRYSNPANAHPVKACLSEADPRVVLLGYAKRTISKR
jgi:hypothetical protein